MDAATLASSQRRCARACSTVSNSDTKGDSAFMGWEDKRRRAKCKQGAPELWHKATAC